MARLRLTARYALDVSDWPIVINDLEDKDRIIALFDEPVVEANGNAEYEDAVHATKSAEILNAARALCEALNQAHRVGGRLEDRPSKAAAAHDLVLNELEKQINERLSTEAKAVSEEADRAFAERHAAKTFGENLADAIATTFTDRARPYNSAVLEEQPNDPIEPRGYCTVCGLWGCADKRCQDRTTAAERKRQNRRGVR